MKIRLFNAVIALFIVAVIVVLLLMFKPFWGEQEANSSAKSLNASDDICATPSGYTDEQWKEHMSHHPDQYKECLQ